MQELLELDDSFIMFNPSNTPENKNKLKILFNSENFNSNSNNIDDNNNINQSNSNNNLKNNN